MGGIDEIRALSLFDGLSDDQLDPNHGTASHQFR